MQRLTRARWRSGCFLEIFESMPNVSIWPKSDDGYDNWGFMLWHRPLTPVNCFRVDGSSRDSDTTT
jgi:hypothetical protein